MEKKKELKSGLTTGAHAFWAFCDAFNEFIKNKECTKKSIIKLDNDDLDVTKGCEIVVTLSLDKDDLLLNPLNHKPQVFEEYSNKISIYAGEGVGVVTKVGLKIAPDFAAINPRPLNAIKDAFFELAKEYEGLNLFCSIGVVDGVNIARHTANEKVGVLGGISILGTTGIVKPVSSTAYIDSVETEIKFALQNGYKRLIFTLGNSAYKKALELYDEEQIVEIGNFVYDSIRLAHENGATEVYFLCGIGKMTKVYQGFKNTHNRFGVIDFKQLREDIKKRLDYEVDIEVTLTVKGISEELERVGKLDDFYSMIADKSNEKIKEWFETSNVKAYILDKNEVLGW